MAKLCYCRRSSILTYLASLELLPSICTHLWQGKCWCPVVAQQSLFPGSWITGMWRTAQWNSGKYWFLIFFPLQLVKLPSIIFSFEGFGKALAVLQNWKWLASERSITANTLLLEWMSWRLNWSLPFLASWFEFHFLSLISTWHPNTLNFLDFFFPGKTSQHSKFSIALSEDIILQLLLKRRSAKIVVGWQLLEWRNKSSFSVLTNYLKPIPVYTVKLIRLLSELSIQGRVKANSILTHRVNLRVKNRS